MQRITVAWSAYRAPIAGWMCHSRLSSAGRCIAVAISCTGMALPCTLARHLTASNAVTQLLALYVCAACMVSHRRTSELSGSWNSPLQVQHPPQMTLCVGRAGRRGHRVSWQRERAS